MGQVSGLCRSIIQRCFGKVGGPLAHDSVGYEPIGIVIFPGPIGEEPSTSPIGAQGPGGVFAEVFFPFFPTVPGLLCYLFTMGVARGSETFGKVQFRSCFL